MIDLLLGTAAFLAFAVGAAHSYLGERFILVRLFRRSDLPRLFGSDAFTRRTVRFAWHVTTVAWWGFGGVFLVLGGAVPSAAAREGVLAVAAATFGASALVALVGSRGRHVSWVVFAGIAAATAAAAAGASPGA